MSTNRCSHSVRRVAERHRRAACATQKRFFKQALKTRRSDSGLKQELTKPGDADPGVPGPERRANYLKLGVLVLASGFAAYIAVWIAMNVVSPFPLEFREN